MAPGWSRVLPSTSTTRGHFAPRCLRPAHQNFALVLLLRDSGTALDGFAGVKIITMRCLGYDGQRKEQLDSWHLDYRILSVARQALHLGNSEIMSRDY